MIDNIIIIACRSKSHSLRISSRNAFECEPYGAKPAKHEPLSALKVAKDMELKPLRSLRISSFQIPAHRGIPNTSIQKRPLLIYHQCVPATSSASVIEKHLQKIGAVTPQWRYTMYSTSHFHSSTHEVLCIAHGSAKLLFGGEGNPDKVEAAVEQGDVIVIPAGVSHRLLEDIQGGFQMIGSYPPGKNWDMCYGNEDEAEKVKGIEKLEWFTKDPIYGDEGPVLTHGTDQS